jgi:anti-sigma factor RsiW
MTSCSDIEPMLSAHLDDELDEATRGEVVTHLAACSSCRELLAGLERVRSALQGVPREVAPGRDLWPEIEAGILAETVVAFKPARRGHVRRWALPLAAAAALVLVTATVTTWFTSRPTAVRTAQTISPPEEVRPASLATGMVTASFAAARRDLLRSLEARRAAMDPETVRAVEENVRIIDAAVRRIELALAREPANSGLQRLLLTAYQQELDLLETATARPLPG